MSRRRLVAVAAVFLALAAGLFTCMRGGGKKGAGTAVADAGPLTQEQILAKRRAARGANRDRTPAALSGRVVDDETGAGIPGAVVLLDWRGWLDDREGSTGEPAQPIHARTDADGRWSLATVPPGPYGLTATAAGYLPGTRMDVDVLPGKPQDGLDLRLGRGGAALTGTVSDVGGGGIGGTVVSAQRRDGGSLLATDRAPFATLTDDAGHYRLDLPPGVYDVVAQHIDYVPGWQDVDLRGARSLDFVLTPAGVITGVVLTRGERKPVAGAVVSSSGGQSTTAIPGLDQLGEALGWGAVVTDAQGRFTLRGLGSGAIEVRAVARDGRSREPTIVDLGIGEQVDGVEVLLDRAYTISGFVVRAGDEAQPISGALVGGLSMKGGIRPTFIDESDESGYFEILGVEPGKYALGAARDGLLPNFMKTIVTVEDKDVTDVLLTVDTGATLRGRVSPPGPATIALSMDDDDIGLGTMFNMIGAALAHGRAGADGKFEIAAVPPGRWFLTARGEDGARGELEVVVRIDDQNDLVIEMKPRASVAGQVLDAAGAPVAGVRVRLRKRGGGDGRVDFGEVQEPGVETDADGRFVARGLEPGNYDASVSDDQGSLDWADGKSPESIELREAEAKTGVLLRVESRSGVIRGRVVGTDGQPVADAWVTARQSGGPSWSREGGGGAEVKVEAKKEGEGGGPPDDSAPEDQGWERGTRPVLSGPDGRFVIRGLREKQKYDLTAEARGARGHKREVKPGADVSVQLKPLGALRGRVTIKGSGAPLVDYQLSIEGPVRKSQRVLHEDGQYVVGRLDAGTYRVSVAGDAGAVKKEVTIDPGKTATLDLEAEAWASVTGVVVDAFTGKPISGLRVAAFSHDLGDPGEMAMDFITGKGPETDEDGRFQVGKLGPGPGTFIAFDGLLAGFQPVATLSFDLKPGERKDLGEIKAITKKEVKREERGTLGMYVAEEGADDAGVGGKLKVVSVDPGGAAESAGVKVGDEVTSVDGYQVALLSPAIARELLSGQYLKPGQVVRLGLLREGQAMEVAVTATAVPKPD